ncbi:DUF805 domain-containing protein [Myxococcota bacterium]|nr:DUF805 domain-containing protein [Myxococcota bacterium]MBU1533696.1 DUF805 domain-containing protein [Myxococcota bacterium]
MVKLLFSFEGRINREPYWYLVLAMLVGYITAFSIDGNGLGEEMGPISMLVILAFIWPSLAIQVKRWHDIDKSGWWVLINFIPIVGSIWSLVENGFTPGTDGPNRYGDNPMDEEPRDKQTP